MFRLNICLAALIVIPAFAQRTANRLGPGMTAPKIVTAPHPDQTPAARDNHIQGTVLMSAIIDETGVLVEIELVSPLGFGLDERALEALRKWRFTPAKTQEGVPVAIYADVEVNFRQEGTFSDDKKERSRTAFNRAMNRIARASSQTPQAMVDLEALSKEKYLPAMAVFGFMTYTGNNVPKDEPKGLALLKLAAEKGDPLALSELGSLHIKGEGVTADKAKGLAMLAKASLLGNSVAQYEIGDRAATGRDMDLDLAKAKRQFRLCAAKGKAPCQYRLAKLLLDGKPPEREKIQAIAWLELAEHEISQAGSLAKAASESLNAEQISWIARIKPQLLRRD